MSGLFRDRAAPRNIATALINRLWEIILKEKLSVYELEHISGYSRRTIHAWLYQGRTPTLPAFNDIVESLGYEIKIEKKQNDTE